MGMPAKATVELRDFPGLLTNIGKYDIPPGGAEVQVNATSIIAGQLVVRAGTKEVTFDDS